MFIVSINVSVLVIYIKKFVATDYSQERIVSINPIESRIRSRSVSSSPSVPTQYVKDEDDSDNDVIYAENTALITNGYLSESKTTSPSIKPRYDDNHNRHYISPVIPIKQEPISSLNYTLSSSPSFSSTYQSSVRIKKEKKILPMRKTTNKQRKRVMDNKRKEIERERKQWIARFKRKNKRKVSAKNNRLEVNRKRTRIELNNATRLKIAKHYIKNKKKNYNYSAKMCKIYFANKGIDCGGNVNIWRWSKYIKLIQKNIGIFGENKIRNRYRKSWYSKMEEKLFEIMNKRTNKNRYFSNQWIKNKAIELNKKFYPKIKFKASNGWLNNFKKRHE